MENKNVVKSDYNIKEIIGILMSRWLMIAGLAIVTGLIFSLFTMFMITPMYSSTAQYYAVDSTNQSVGSDNSELTYLQKIVDTYIELFKTDVFMDNVIVSSGIEKTTGQLKGMVSLSGKSGTSIFSVTVTGSNPDEIMLIQNTIAELAPDMIKGITTTGEVVICDPAKTPTSPISPNQTKNTLLGVVLGFAVGVFLALLLDMLDQNIKGKQELEDRCSLPVLSQIPSFEEDKKEIKKKKKMKKNNNNVSLRTINMIDENTDFAITESYKTLRTNLQFTIHGNKCKKIILTSPIPQDGKSTTSVNLAITMAQTGHKVLLVDGDMRKGRVHKYFDLHNDVGLSNLISGMADIDTTIKTVKKYNNLCVLTSGTIPPNPSELAASEEMKQLMDKLSEKFEYILIDSPPINIVSDSIPLSKLADGVVVVVRQNKSTYAEIETALNSFRLVNSNIIGLVLNDVDISTGKSYGKYKYKYKYGYNAYSHYEQYDNRVPGDSEKKSSSSSESEKKSNSGKSKSK
ncbi:MAG: polysaccharide biosynthesis tyrosine autokinase [Oscillospiraceae bacterium]|nr:polysaccharide biosynthesis tyrosine autokinase [Oscillospiraceae bacterium]